MDPAQAGPAREQEERDGALVVGVDVVEFLEGYQDGVMEPTLGLRRDLCRAMRRLKPDVVVTGSHDLRFRPGMSNQADHRAVGICVLDAAKDCGNRWIFPELVAEGYEPWKGLKAVIMGASTSRRTSSTSPVTSSRRSPRSRRTRRTTRPCPTTSRSRASS